MRMAGVVAGLVALLVGSASADMTFDPVDYESGAYLLDPAEAASSWTQRIWVNTSNLGVSGSWQKVTYQFRICTNPADVYGPQTFENPDGFELQGYGQGHETVWQVDYGPNKEVEDAKVWAWGGPTGAGSGDFVYLTFTQGIVDTYIGPAEWWEVPEFVLQMQAYGYKVDGEVERILNVEFYASGAANSYPGGGESAAGTGTQALWGITSGGTSQPRPAYKSGYTHDVLGLDWAGPEWTLNEPLPVPPALLLGLVGLGLVGWRARRRA